MSGKRKCRASLNLHMQRNDQFFPSNDAAPGGCPTEFFNRIGRVVPASFRNCSH